VAQACRNLLLAANNRSTMEIMATIHISEGEVAGELPGLLAKVQAGDEVMIEGKSGPIAVIRSPDSPPYPPTRTPTEDAEFKRLMQLSLDILSQPRPSMDRVGRARAAQEFLNTCEDISREARKNGLTDEIAEEILREI
jgi:antitoxin (DNA-binding transcriptional repressor) of toxin-antitoxin stability system